MAVVKAPALSLAASGNIGAINYTTWRGLAVARSTFIATDPNTGPQQAQRALLTSVSQAWGAVGGSVDRGSWAARAQNETFINRLGQAYIPTGYNLFMKWNLQLKVIGESVLNDAPNAEPFALVGRMTMVADPILPGEITMKQLASLSGPDIFPDAVAVVYFLAGPYDSEGRRPIEPEYRLVKVQKPPALFTASGLASGKWYWGKAYTVQASGQRGNWWEQQADAVTF